MVKTNVRQLKMLIMNTLREASENRANSIRQRPVREADGARSDDYAASIDSLMTAVGKVWTAQYNDSDPSMSTEGPEAWDEQVNSALAKLEGLVSDAIKSVEAELHGGEFYV